jgi:hypothetical protein
VNLVRQQHKRLGQAVGAQVENVPGQDSPPDTPLHNEVRLLVQVANGEMLRAHTPPAILAQVESALHHLLELLLGNALQTPLMIPDDFWRTEIGILVSRVRWWLSADDLITISNAAALAFGENTQANRMRIARAIQQGQLDWVPDPSVSNPQQNKRVLRPQVERLRDLNRLPQ